MTTRTAVSAEAESVAVCFIFCVFVICQPLSKALVSMSVSQFYCDESDATTMCPTVTTLSGETSQWRFVDEYVAAGRDWRWYYVGWLIFTIVVIRILIAYTVNKVSYLKR